MAKSETELGTKPYFQFIYFSQEEKEKFLKKSPSSSYHVQHLSNSWLFTVYVLFIIHESFLHLP